MDGDHSTRHRPSTRPRRSTDRKDQSPWSASERVTVNSAAAASRPDAVTGRGSSAIALTRSPRDSVRCWAAKSAGGSATSSRISSRSPSRQAAK
ncbi:hypothetical protein LUX73_06325 [Actinomadura madurae]|nr:hypothetical protein [Actinomadura madurae]MCQ0004375.1 hypothetical protein [Actinomadura madurae]